MAASDAGRIARSAQKRSRRWIIRATARKWLLGIVDQAVSSSSNLAITVMAARTLDPEEFGGFAFVMAVCIVAGGLARALALEPLLVRGGDNPRDALQAMAGAVMGLGALAGLGCLLAGALLDGGSGPALIALGLSLPLLFLQDGWRHAAFADGHPQRALVVDLVWLALLALAVPLLTQGSPTAATFMVAWAASGAVSAVIGALHVRVFPRVSLGVQWVRSNLDLGGPFVLEFLAAGGAAYAGLGLLGVTSGLAAVGAVRVGQTVFGPINVLYMGIYLTLVPEGARLRGDGSALRRAMSWASATLVAVASLATTIAYLLPAGIGEAFFGESWSQAHSVVVPLGLALCGGGAMAGAIAGLRSLGQARVALRARLVTLPLTLVLPLLGAMVGDAVGFSAGLAVATWLAAAVWWVAFSAEARSRAPLGEEVDEAMGHGAGSSSRSGAARP